MFTDASEYVNVRKHPELPVVVKNAPNPENADTPIHLIKSFSVFYVRFINFDDFLADFAHVLFSVALYLRSVTDFDLRADPLADLGVLRLIAPSKIAKNAIENGCLRTQKSFAR